MRNESEGSVRRSCDRNLCRFSEWARGHYRPIVACDRFEFEQCCRDPKEDDLCQSRVKPGETLVEARSDTDVQIVRRRVV